VQVSRAAFEVRLVQGLFANEIKLTNKLCFQLERLVEANQDVSQDVETDCQTTDNRYCL
jgi:hypothetical protein